MELQRRAGLEDDGMESSGTSCGPDMFRDRSQGASGAPPIGAGEREDGFQQFAGEEVHRIERGWVGSVSGMLRFLTFKRTIQWTELT